MIIDVIKRTAVIEVRIGPRGRPGEDGSGTGGSLPEGGTTGQVLAKKSNADGDADWQSLGGAASLDVGSIAGTVCAGDDSRLSDPRIPTGNAGGVLAGTYPNPTFAVDMATQSELENALATKADLVGGKVPSSQIPSIALTEYLGPVSSESAMILLTGQPGDYCFRTDEGLAYFLISGTGSSVGNWQAVSTPATSGVVSVNGQDGVVVLGPEDIGLTLPLPVANGGTGSATADDAKIALAIEEINPGQQEINEVQLQSVTSSDYNGTYLDMVTLDGTVRFWINDGGATAPSSAGVIRLVECSINPDGSITGWAEEIAGVIDGELEFSAGKSGSNIIVTHIDNYGGNVTSSSGVMIVTNIQEGISPFRMMTTMDGRQIGNVNAATLENLPSSAFATAAHTHGFTSLTNRPRFAATSTNSVSSTTNLEDLMTAAVERAGAWGFEATGLIFSNLTLEGLALAVNGPTSSSIIAHFTIPHNGIGAVINGTVTAWETKTTNTAGPGNSARGRWHASGRFVATSSGTFAIRFSAETGGANSVTIPAGATLRLFPL